MAWVFALLRSFHNALAGIWYVIRTQRNAQIHLLIATLVIMGGAFLRLSLTHWAILTLTIGLVMAAEIFNTALEALVDLISPDFHPLAKITKDTAAGAVLILTIVAAIVGLLILGPSLWKILQSFFSILFINY